jgi:hypothetical protein
LPPRAVFVSMKFRKNYSRHRNSTTKFLKRSLIYNPSYIGTLSDVSQAPYCHSL